MRTDFLDTLAENFRHTKNVIIVGHTGPDGDSVASSLAVAEIVRQIRNQTHLKHAIHVLGADPYPLPPTYKNLPGFDDTESGRAWQHRLWCNWGDALYELEHPLFICVDHATQTRFGGCSRFLFETAQHVTWMIIDHHQQNPSDTSFVDNASFAVIDPDAPSATSVIFDLLENDRSKTKIDMTSTLATNLYAGIVNDTENFSNSATSTRAYIMAAKLLEKGADAPLVLNDLVNKAPHTVRKAEAAIINNTKIKDRIATCAITQEEFRSWHLRDGEGAGLANVIKKIDGADIYIYMRQYDDGAIRGSIRTEEGYDATELASIFGGGGHVRAAGFKTYREESLADVERKLFDKASEMRDAKLKVEKTVMKKSQRELET